MDSVWSKHLFFYLRSQHFYAHLNEFILFPFIKILLRCFSCHQKRITSCENFLFSASPNYEAILAEIRWQKKPQKKMIVKSKF